MESNPDLESSIPPSSSEPLDTSPSSDIPLDEPKAELESEKILPESLVEEGNGGIETEIEKREITPLTPQIRNEKEGLEYGVGEISGDLIEPEEQEEIFEVNVTFLIKPENYVLKEMFMSNCLISEIRDTMAKKLSIMQDHVELFHSGVHVANDGKLSDVNLSRLIDFAFEMNIAYVAPAPPPVVEIPYIIPNRIQVHVQKPDGDNVVIVEITKSESSKPFFGGFKHKLKGTTYLHASIQTVPTKPPPEVQKFERESQTSKVTSRSVQTKREASTQMSKRGVLILSNDKIIESRPYITADEFLLTKIINVVKIQCVVRGWLARRKVQNLREKRYQDQLSLWQKQQDESDKNEMRIQDEMQRRMHPKTSKDFAMISEELEAWRSHETRTIKENKTFTAEEKTLKLKELLQKETKLLQTIDKLKANASKQNKISKVKDQLTSMAAPKTWKLSDGNVAVVHTPFTTRATELNQLYNGLRLPNPTMEERLDILLHVKWTVKEFDCNLTREIVSLIDREIDMLKRGRSESSISGLRQRMANLFLQFIETPEFNPESQRFQKVAVK